MREPELVRVAGWNCVRRRRGDQCRVPHPPERPKPPAQCSARASESGSAPSPAPRGPGILNGERSGMRSPPRCHIQPCARPDSATDSAVTASTNADGIHIHVELLRNTDPEQLPHP